MKISGYTPILISVLTVVLIVVFLGLLSHGGGTAVIQMSNESRHNVEMARPLATVEIATTRGRSKNPSWDMSQEEGFDALFSRAVAAMPMTEFKKWTCCSNAKAGDMSIYQETTDYLSKAWECPGSVEGALEIAASEAALLNFPMDKRNVKRLSAKYHYNFSRFQCGGKILKWELERLAREEPKPRPGRSPVTKLAGRILGIVDISPIGASLAVYLLSEKDVATRKRGRFLRKIHKLDLESRIKPRADMPWISPAMIRLFPVLLDNMLVLGEITGKEADRQYSSGRYAPEIGVSYSDAEAEAAVLAKWKGCGKRGRMAALDERTRLASALVCKIKCIDGALRTADLYFRTYPKFGFMKQDAWPNLAWKKGAVKGIINWIRERWDDDTYKIGLEQALDGLIVGGGLVDKKDRALVEAFLVEIWKSPFPLASLKGMALASLGKALTLQESRIEKLLMEALQGEGRKSHPWDLAYSLIQYSMSGRGKESFFKPFGAILDDGKLDKSIRAELEALVK